MGRKRRCVVCKQESLLYLRASNSAFCRDHYIEYFERKVFKAVKSFRMFVPDQKILVAVSGGKDSIALLHLLHKHSYTVSGYYIDLGLDAYSDNSTKKVEEFSDATGISVRIDRVKDILGVGIAEVARRLGRPACAICGTVKRYLMNQAAQEFDVVATGHNLDDEGATLLGNLLHWQTGYLLRQSACLEEDGTLSRKVKPLIYMTEFETANYAFMEGLDTLVEECPESYDATSIVYKHALNMLEHEMPGTKHGFIKGFLKKKDAIFTDTDEEKADLGPCEVCGYLTTAGVCSVCRIKEKLSDRD